MLDNVIPHLTEQQKQDGEVDRPEFDPDYDVQGWPLLSDPAQRQKLENYVLRKCISERHRFKMADGSDAVVYFDARGRAAQCRITEMPDADLVRLAKEAGKRFPGQKDPKKPQTGKKDHGYTPPVQEEVLLEGAGDPISIGFGKQMAVGRKKGAAERGKYTDPDDLSERLSDLGEMAARDFGAASRSAKVLEHYGFDAGVLGRDHRTMRAVKDLEKELTGAFFLLGEIYGLRGGEKK